MSSSSKPIICCGFTPAIQRIITLKKIKKGAVNRAESVTIGIGGKGANVARMIHQLNGRAELIEFSGGKNGRLLEQLLNAEGIGYRHIEVDGETRICQTLVESGNPDTTELVEEMPPITSNDWKKALLLFQTLEHSGSWTALSGKLPAGAPTDGYAEICRIAKEAGGKLIVDTQGEPLMHTLQHHPDLVKINSRELADATGTDEISAGCRKLIERGAQAVFITRGRRPSLYVDALRSLEIDPPEIQAVNPTGSGDAVTAGLTLALNSGSSLKEALVQGTACGAANALNLLSGHLIPKDIERLKTKVRVKRIT
ncbi:1-phosphofructokinase family hexose kinase [Pontiella agarivorans]|uniref:Hexose kinase n=1 Tax=Pontiella agarivorans TaxID=3038953 RepID=A0ABU5MTD8_9BACT|nr:hexose kinase [Pontiella agarivorans]MDZ8117462.1 hexose kinase [Pontiella agarivorans]